MKHPFFCILFLWMGLGYGQDTSIVKTVYGGSSITVPSGVTWQIERAFVNDGTGYNLQIRNANFKSSYTSEEKIFVPLYIAEMELLDKKDGIYYILYIHQRKE